MTRLESVSLIAPVALLVVSLAGCGTGGGDALTIYSGQHEQTTSLLVSAFERETGVAVDVRSGDESALANQVLQEGSSSPADVFYSENTPVLEALREHGRLAPVAPSTMRSIPRRYDSPDGDWVGVSARVTALVYNTSRLRAAQLPGSILQLAEPRWKGKVAFAPSETDFQPLIEAIARLDGTATAERWLKGLQSNGTAVSDNEALVTAVNEGQSALGPVDHYYWYRLRDEVGRGSLHSALHLLAPRDPGGLVDVSGAAVLKSSSHRGEAQRFLAFLVSARGQRIIAEGHSYEYPLRPGVAAAAILPPLSTITPAPLTPAELGDGSSALALEQRLGLL
jgi:iron(III) transport system substrate-binding protein